MSQIFPKPQMSLEQKCLLLYLFNEIIENDVIADRNDWKELWSEKWKLQINAFLRAKRRDIETLGALRDPNDKSTDIVNNLDLGALYNKMDKQAVSDLYTQCLNFEPYNWFDLLSNENRREKEWHKKLYKKIKSLCPKLTLEQGIRGEFLKVIADYLHVNVKP